MISSPERAQNPSESLRDSSLPLKKRRFSKSAEQNKRTSEKEQPSQGVFDPRNLPQGKSSLDSLRLSILAFIASASGDENDELMAAANAATVDSNYRSNNNNSLPLAFDPALISPHDSDRTTMMHHATVANPIPALGGVSRPPCVGLYRLPNRDCATCAACLLRARQGLYCMPTQEEDEENPMKNQYYRVNALRPTHVEPGQSPKQLSGLRYSVPNLQTEAEPHSSHKRKADKERSVSPESAANEKVRLQDERKGELRTKRDQRFRGLPGEVRCRATTTRGRACVHIVAEGNKHYCNRHSRYESFTSDQTPNTAATKSSHVLEKNLNDNGPSYPPLSKLTTDRWGNSSVLVSVGPYAGRIGRVQDWANGWVRVQLDGVGMYNRRSSELFLVSEASKDSSVQ